MNKEEIRSVYKKSSDLIIPHIKLENSQNEIVQTSKEEKVRILKEGIAGMETVIKHSPSNWPARWLIGKAKQSLELHEEAYQSFLAAHRIILTDQDVMRELALECLHTKRFKEAIYYCNSAIEFNAEDFTLWANMAISQLFNENIELAEKWAKKTLEKIPKDEPSINIMKIINEIKEGKRTIPTDFQTLLDE